MPRSYGWNATPIKVVDTTIGQVRISAHVQSAGARAGWPRLVAQLPDNTWMAVQVDAKGRLMALVRNQPTYGAAGRAINTALKEPEPPR
jgi:hypothetical protein